MESYLTAEELEPEQLSRVVDLGTGLWTDRGTIRYLSDALDGPDSAAILNLESRFSYSYRRLPASTITEASFIQQFVENVESVYRARAAEALGAIGGDRSIRALEAALERDSASIRPARADVRDALHRAVSTARTSPFDGIVVDSVADVLDTITVYPGSRNFRGDERIELVGGPFPEDVMLPSQGPTLRFVLAAPIGSYSATIESGSSQGDMRFGIKARGIDYTPATPGSAVELWEHRSRSRLYTVLTGVADSLSGAVISGSPVDFFQLNPAYPVNAVATVDWRGPGRINVVWTDCVKPVPTTGRLVGVVLDSGLRPIPNARLEILGRPFSVLSDSFGRFEITPPQIAAPFVLRIRRTGSGQRDIEVVDVGNRAVAVLWDPPAPAPPVPDSVRRSPYEVFSDTARATVPADECRLLRVQKLDRETGHVVARVSVSY